MGDFLIERGIYRGAPALRQLLSFEEALLRGSLMGNWSYWRGLEFVHLFLYVCCELRAVLLLVCLLREERERERFNQLTRNLSPTTMRVGQREGKTSPTKKQNLIISLLAINLHALTQGPGLQYTCVLFLSLSASIHFLYSRLLATRCIHVE